MLATWRGRVRYERNFEGWAVHPPKGWSKAPLIVPSAPGGGGVVGAVNPYARHYQSAWEDRAANHNLPLWARIVCLAYGRHHANGHATFGRGELTWILGTPPQGGKPFQKASRQGVHKAITVAVNYGFLDEDSGMECLVVPGHAIAGPLGKPNAPCAVHERKYRARRNKMGLVS